MTKSMMAKAMTTKTKTTKTIATVKRWSRRAALVALPAMMLAALGTQAQAKWPEKPVRIILPFGAGGVADVTARILADQLSKKFDQRVIIENMPGPGGINAANAIISADPDGYTMGYVTNGTAISVAAFKSLPFQVAISVFYAAVVWMLVRSARIPELRGLIKRAFEMTMRLTAMVVFILIGSTCFSTVFQGVNGGPWLEHLMTSIPGGVWGFLIAVNLFIFFIAFFLDFFEIVFILVPLLAPIAKTLLTPIVGADAALIWFGVMLCVNLQTSFMHPPFGFALFYLRGVAPKEVKSSDIYWGALPFVGLQLILVAMVIAFPKQVTMFLDKPLDVDLDKVKIELQSPDSVRDDSSDIMKSFGGQMPAPAAEPKAEPGKSSEDDDLMKSFGAPKK